jgi:hypothetical protein
VAQTPVRDHANQHLRYLKRDEARELMKHPEIEVIGTPKRVIALRWRGPDPAHLMGGSHARRPIGQPHKNESYFNLRGVWHLDFIPEHYREHLIAVLLQLMREKEEIQ